MKILLIHQYFLESNDAGGSRFNEMVKMWQEKGHQITVIAGMVHYATGKKTEKYKGKFICKEQYNNIEIIRCHVSEAYNTNFIGRLWAYFSFVFSSSLAGIFKTNGKYDIVLATSPPLFVGITAYIVSRVKRAKLVFEVRDLWPESAIDTGILKSPFLIKLSYNFEKFIYKKSHLINTLTPAFEKTLIEKKQVPKSKIIMIPNGSDFQIVKNALNNFDRNLFRKDKGWDEKMVVIYVGAHGVANHLIQLVEVAEKFNNNSTVKFVLVGDGMEKPMLIKKAKEKNLQNIEFIASQPKLEIFKYIAAADIGISILKKNDTFKTVYSNKTFDYFACKKPVIMAIDGVSRELVEKANAGIYAEPENINDIASKIDYYLNHPDTANEHGLNGYHYALEHFDRSKLADTYLDKLNILINDNTKSKN
jgi:glycosyltransferase involved in cell wall biosynthesis